MLPSALRSVALAALAVALLAGCGADGDGSGQQDADDLGLEHVHGLGVNPADDALYIATHYGVFRSAEGSESVELVGEGLQDTMGFTAVGPDRFLASGHPGPGEDGPANLGLIESTDGGETWSEVSLGGEADFHALVFAHERVYGYDATAGRLMLSDDGGQSWEERRPPAPVIDLAVDPDDERRIVLSTQAGLAVSEDGGRRWEPLGAEDRIGLLAWPAGGELMMINAEGRVYASPDDGERWSEVGEIGGQPAAFIAEGPDELYAALPEGTILESVDAGSSWEVRSMP